MITKQRLRTISMMLGVVAVMIWALSTVTIHFAEAETAGTAALIVQQVESGVAIGIETDQPIAALAFNVELGITDPSTTCTPSDAHTQCNPAYQAGVARVNRVSYEEPINGTVTLITLNIDPAQSSALIFNDVQLYTNDIEEVTATLNPNVPLAVGLRGEAADHSPLLITSIIILLFALLIFITRRFNATLLILPIVGIFGILMIVANAPATATRAAIKLGDTDCDGDVTIIDMLLIDQYTSNVITGKYLACPDSLGHPAEPNTLFLPACDVNLSSEANSTSGTECTSTDLNQIATCDVDVAVDNQFCTETNQYTVIVNEIDSVSVPGEVSASGTVVVTNGAGNIIYDYSYALSTVLWDLTIPVCWLDPTPENADGRTWTRDAVANTWEVNSDVQFTGWGSCPAENDQETIRIAIRDNAADGAHTKGLGRQIRLADDGMVLNFTFENWNEDCPPLHTTQGCIEMIAVHEFGHALGFAHEQNRPDTPNWCNREQGSDGDILIGDWDIDSVMNYCNPNYNNDGNLSTGDIAAVQQFYTAQSPVFESDFESGGEWNTFTHTSYPATTVSRSNAWWHEARGDNGSYGQSISNLANGYLYSPKIGIEQGETYDLSASIRGELPVLMGQWIIRLICYDASGTHTGCGSESPTHQLDVDSSGGGILGEENGGLSPDEFNRFGGSAVLDGADVTHVRVELWMARSIGWVTFDDISLTRQGDTTNLVSDPGFEINNSWSQYIDPNHQGTTISRGNAWWHEASGDNGSYGQSISNLANGYLYSPKIGIEQGETYDLYASIRGELPLLMGQWMIRLICYDASGTDTACSSGSSSNRIDVDSSGGGLLGEENGGLSPDEFNRFGGSAVLDGADVTHVRIELWMSRSIGWITFDNISLTKQGDTTNLVSDTGFETNDSWNQFINASYPATTVSRSNAWWHEASGSNGSYGQSINNLANGYLYSPEIPVEQGKTYDLYASIRGELPLLMGQWVVRLVCYDASGTHTICSSESPNSQLDVDLSGAGLLGEENGGLSPDEFNRFGGSAVLDSADVTHVRVELWMTRSMGWVAFDDVVLIER